MSRNRFGIVSHRVITDPELSIGAKGVYSIISVYANKQRCCYPSISRLADDANISISTVNRKLKELKEKKYIHRHGKFIKIL
jgi:DNA-binding MarR family transcriptional regulator